jgi:alpha-L-rhamnosidase
MLWRVFPFRVDLASTANLGFSAMSKIVSLLASCCAISLLLAGSAAAERTPSLAVPIISQAAAPDDLRTETAPILLGTGVARPRLSWLPHSARQTGYRIQVASSERALDRGELVWDSGEVESARNSQIEFAGAPLSSRMRYIWRVRTRDAAQRWSTWSNTGTWEMGLLSPADWSARWISALAEQQHLWSDAATEWQFTAIGDSVDFLFRARPVGKSFGEAYVWRLEMTGPRPQILAISRSYDAKRQPLVNETILKAIPLPIDEAALIAGRHSLRIEAKGTSIITWLDGKVLDRLQDATHREGTSGLFQAGSAPLGLASLTPDAIILHSLTVTPARGTAVRADFLRNENPLSGGTVEADGLHIANAKGVDIVFPVASPAALLRKTFEVGQDVTLARLYVAAGGMPRIEINGRPINEAVGDGFTAYDRRVLYRTFDVTDRINRGGNAIGVELGRGWYDLAEPNEWYWHEAPWTARTALLLQLELTFADGSRQIVASDDSWRMQSGPTLHDSIYAGERYDARLAPRGWSTAGFDDRGWRPASFIGGPSGRLFAAEQQPIAVTGILKPTSLRQVKPGVWVFDFGRIFAGRLRLKVAGPTGQTVSMVQHEKLRPDGTVLAAGGLVDAQLQTDQYTLAGGGSEEWAPQFGYRGFRYVEVRGFPGTPTLDSITGEVMHSNVASMASFESSNPLINQIQEAARATILNNMHGFQTDTPTFEKNGWTGDAQASALASALNFDVARIWTKWMGDFRDAQAHNGEIPEIVPSTSQYGYEGTPGWTMLNGPTPSWDAATFILPNDLYQLTGDTRLLSDMYQTQKQLVDYTLTWFTSDTFLYRQIANVALGEYAAPRQPLTPEMLAAFAASAEPGAKPPEPKPGNIDSVAAAFLFSMTDQLARNAAILGNARDSARYAAKAQDIRAAFNKTYWDAALGYYRVPTAAGTQPVFVQYQNILPVAFGLVPDGKAAAVMQKINADLVAHDYHLSSTGVFSGRHLLTLLSDYGYGETAYRLVTQTTQPSWGFWIANDIHTMLEGWELDSRSFNHHYWGSVSSWFYQGLAGIRPGSPGYEKLIIRPVVPRGLDHVSARLDTVRGRVGSEWHQADGRLTLDVLVPDGAEAEVWCPGKVFAKPRYARLLRANADYAVYAVGSGHHRFIATLGR